MKDGSTVHMHLRLRGGGGDGGATGAESRSSYLEMYMEKKPDKVLSGDRTAQLTPRSLKPDQVA